MRTPLDSAVELDDLLEATRGSCPEVWEGPERCNLAHGRRFVSGSKRAKSRSHGTPAERPADPVPRWPGDPRPGRNEQPALARFRLTPAAGKDEQRLSAGGVADALPLYDGGAAVADVGRVCARIGSLGSTRRASTTCRRGSLGRAGNLFPFGRPGAAPAQTVGSPRCGSTPAGRCCAPILRSSALPVADESGHAGCVTGIGVMQSSAIGAGDDCCDRGRSRSSRALWRRAARQAAPSAHDGSPTGCDGRAHGVAVTAGGPEFGPRYDGRLLTDDRGVAASRLPDGRNGRSVAATLAAPGHRRSSTSPRSYVNGVDARTLRRRRRRPRRPPSRLRTDR